jgi:hypothetical protein
MSEQLLVCKALAAMLREHGEPTEEEVSFVAHSAFELGLSEGENAEVQRALREGDDYGRLLEGITSKPMRTYLFRRIVAATLIDEKLEDQEMAAIQLAARAFGFKSEAVQAYLGWMKEGIAWEKRGAEVAAAL